MGLYGLSMYPDGYNIYAGGGSPENRAAFEKSLDKFIAANPKVGNIDTEMFRDFMIALADHESSFRSKAANNVGNYSGYYGLLNGSKMTEEEQHRAAYNHLKKIFTENMVKEDIVKASELGITPAQLLIKYWNQGNRVTNYLYNGKDSTDGLGTKVSEYGNDINLDLDYSTYLPSAITSDFVTVEKGKNSLSNAIKLARIPGMDYSNRESYITDLNKEYNKGFDSRKLQVGDMIWLVPKSDSVKQDAGNTPTKSNQVHFLEVPQGEYQVSPYNMPSFKTPYIPTQSIDLNTKEGFDNPILQYRANTKATGGPITKYDTKIPKEKEQAYAQWVESLPLNLRDDHDYDLRGAFLEGLKPDKYGHMSDKYKKPWHPTFSNESIYSTKDMQGGHWEGDEFIPSPWQERRQQLINSMNLMEPNTFSNGGKKPDWDPENPYHIHTEDGKKVSFTPEAYAALTSDLKRQVDEHAAAMNTFENQYMVNPEWTDFQSRVQAARMAENVAASRGEYWDRNWLDPNYKLGAYTFDENGLLTYQGQTYAPFGDSSQQGIIVPMRTPSGISYGANVAYYPVNVPQQYIERPEQEVNNTINEEQVKAALDKAYTNYIMKNTTKKVLYPRYGTDNYGSKHIQNIYNGDGKLKYNTPYVHKKDSEYYAVFVDDLDEEDRKRGLVGVDYYPMSTIGQYKNKPINVPGKYGLSVDISNIGTEDEKGALRPASSYTKELFPVQYIETKPSEEETKRNVQITLDDIDYLGNSFSDGGGIHIKPENKGKFTAAAKRAGKSVQGYASQILANPDNYSSTLVKRANFARNAAKWHACGGKLYPDGGPIDPPWASFVPSQPREPQVVRPQQQVNPYLLGLASGSGRVNPSVQYTTVAQTPEFQQGMRDAEAAFASTAEFKDNTRGEEGARAVSPVLSVIPGTGDVKDFADIGEYYQNTGNLGSSLGMAAFTVLSPVQGVAGKFGKWLSKPWKERGKFRKSFDIAAPLSAGIGGGAYVYDRVSTNNRNFTPSIDEQEWMEKDSVTLRNEALKNKRDSLDQVERYNYLISQGYSPEEALAILSGGAQYE